MLSQLYEDGAVLLERAEGTFGASEVAGFELLVVVGFIVTLEYVAIAVGTGILAIECSIGLHQAHTLLC